MFDHTGQVDGAPLVDEDLRAAQNLRVRLWKRGTSQRCGPQNCARFTADRGELRTKLFDTPEGKVITDML